MLRRNKARLYLTFTSHIDLPWLWRIPESIETWKNTSDSVLDLMENYPEFYFAQGSAQGYKWMEEMHPKTFKSIRERIGDGRWEIVGGMWVEPDCNIPSGESIVRNILYGKLYFKEKFGVEPKIAFVPDSFGYARTLAQIFANAGFDWFVTQKLRWNATNEFPYDVFRWIGPDGSSIKVYMPYRYDETLNDENRISKEFKKHQKKAGLNKLLVLAGMGDHGGGPNEPMLIKSYNLRVSGIDEVVNSRLGDFLKSLDKERLPVYDDELYLEFHQGSFTTNGRTKSLNRYTEVLLEDLEKFSTMSLLETGNDYPKYSIRKTWEKALLNQFHDTLSGTCIKDAHKDAYASYGEIISSGKDMLNKSLLSIAQNIDTQGDGIPVVVFNPLSFERKDVVKLDINLDSDGYGVYDKGGKRALSHYGNGMLSFIAEGVPSIGYKTFWIKKDGKHESIVKLGDSLLENNLFRIEVDKKTGNMSRIFDKRLGKEMLQAGKQGNILQLLEDKPDAWDAWNIGYTGNADVINNVEDIRIIENNQVFTELLLIKNYGKSRFLQGISIYNGIERIDIKNLIDWREKHVLLKAAFPVSVSSDYATYEIPYGVIERPTKSKSVFDAAKFEVPGGKWADLSENSHGISLLNDSKYGWDIKNNTMRLTLLRSPTYPNPNNPQVPVKEMDDDFFTDIGRHAFTYSIYPHAGDWKSGNTIKRAHELNYKLIPAIESQHDGGLPHERSFTMINNDNFLITAIKPAEESDNIVFRFYENFGKYSTAEITLPKTPKSVYLSDMMERTISELSFNACKVMVPTKPYEIKTMLVDFGR